jgi:hypothetical protein
VVLPALAGKQTKIRVHTVASSGNPNSTHDNITHEDFFSNSLAMKCIIYLQFIPQFPRVNQAYCVEILRSV